MQWASADDFLAAFEEKVLLLPFKGTDIAKQRMGTVALWHNCLLYHKCYIAYNCCIQLCAQKMCAYVCIKKKIAEEHSYADHHQQKWKKDTWERS